MRTLQLGLMTAVLCLAAGEARAQGGYGAPIGDALSVLGGLVDTALITSSLIPASVCGYQAVVRARDGWCTVTAGLGVLHLVLGGATLAFARRDYRPTVPQVLGVGQMAFGAVQLLIPLVAWLREAPSEAPLTPPPLVPVVIGGQSPGGHRWSGLGLEVTL